MTEIKIEPVVDEYYVDKYGDVFKVVKKTDKLWAEYDGGDRSNHPPMPVRLAEPEEIKRRNNMVEDNTISDEELKTWAQERYPEFADNLELMRHKWEEEQKITWRPDPGYDAVNIGDIKDGAYVEISGLVARELRNMSYMGCAKCKRKRKGQLKCENCGASSAKEYNVVNYLIGDKTGTTVAVAFYPIRNQGVKIEIGKVLTIRGRVKSKRDGKLEIGINEVINGGEKVDEKMVEIRKSVVDQIGLFYQGIKESSLKLWFERMQFEYPYDDVMKEIKIVKAEQKEMDDEGKVETVTVIKLGGE